MSELEECPFCGGEAVIVRQRKKGRTRDVVNAFARCKSCGARSKNVSTLHVAERNLETYAVRAWNARWERTCHMNYTSLYDEEGADGIECGECGWSELYDPGYPHPAHCPGCGAKVVSE